MPFLTVRAFCMLPLHKIMTIASAINNLMQNNTHNHTPQRAFCVSVDWMVCLGVKGDVTELVYG